MALTKIKGSIVDIGTLSIATETVKGFMSSTDKVKLDGIETGATADQTSSEILESIKQVDGDSSGLDADLLDGQHGSYYRNADNMNAGTLPGGRISDISHGGRGGGTLHNVATQSVHGFMSSTDKTKLDGIETGAKGDQTPSEILSSLITVAGSGSGLDADLLDGHEGSYYLTNDLIGEVKIWTMASIPSKWLICDGSLISRVIYADLFTVIGTTYGIGDGSTTFGIPDYRGQFLRGWDNGAGVDPDAASRTGGDTVGSTQGDANKSHDHEIFPKCGGAYIGNGAYIQPATQYYNQPGLRTGLTGGNEARPKNIYVNYIIYTGV